MKTASRTQAERKRAGLYFLISFVIIVLLLIYRPQFFWLALPFVLGYVVVALDKI